MMSQHPVVSVTQSKVDKMIMQSNSSLAIQMLLALPERVLDSLQIGPSLLKPLSIDEGLGEGVDTPVSIQ